MDNSNNFLKFNLMLLEERTKLYEIYIDTTPRLKKLKGIK